MKIFTGKDMKNKFSYLCQLNSLELWNALCSCSVNICSEYFILWCCTLEGWLVLYSTPATLQLTIFSSMQGIDKRGLGGLLQTCLRLWHVWKLPSLVPRLFPQRAWVQG